LAVNHKVALRGSLMLFSSVAVAYCAPCTAAELHMSTVHEPRSGYGYKCCRPQKSDV